MADATMLNLPVASSVDGSEYAWIVQGGTDKRVTLDAIANTSPALLPAGGLNGQVLIKQSDADYDTEWFTVTGVGTVTSVGLSMPAIFSVTGSPVTAAGTLTASLATQTENTVWAGPETAPAAAPTFRALVNADLPVVSAAKGGTGISSYAVGDIIYASGATTLAKLADVATGNALISGGVTTAPAWGKIGLTTHVSGILPLANGGTNAALVASNGGIFYSTATAAAVLSGTATANQVLVSGSSAAPSWSTSTFPATAAAGTVLAAATANVISATAAPTLGIPGTTIGTLALAGNSSGTATITPQAAAGSPTLTLPNASGTFAVSAAAPLALSATTGALSVTGAAGTVLAGAGPAFTATPTLGVAGATLGTLAMAGNTSGTITIQPQAAAGTYNFNLPTAAGTSGQPLLSGGGGAGAMTFGTLGVDGGGTGVATVTAYAVLCGGTTSIGAFQSIAGVGTAAQVLASNGAGALPSMQSLSDCIEFVIDGGGSTIATGIKGDLEIPYGCTVTRATMLADQSGSIVVDLWVDSYANFPPTDADSITAAAPPTISATTNSQDSTLTGWTTALASGSIIRYNVDSVTSIQRVTVSLKVTRTAVT